MSFKIKKKSGGIGMNRFIIIIHLLFLLYGQGFAQWQKTNLPSSSKVNTLAICDSSIYAGTEGDGIFVSTDNGENWVSINNGLQNKVVHSIFVNGKTIFAGTEGGASYSTNNGLNWSTINSGLAGKGVWSFAINNFMPGNSIIFAGTWSGIYTSTNNGTSWNRSLSNTNMPVHSIVVNNNYIFAATMGGGVFKSSGNGFGWQDFSIIILDEYFQTPVAIIPVYSLAAIGSYIFASAGDGTGSFYRAAFTDTLFNPAGSTSSRNKPNLCFANRDAVLFTGNLNGEIFFTDNYGTHWNHIFPSLTNEIIYSLVLNNLFIFAGTENGIWRLPYPDPATKIDNFKSVPTGFSLEQNYPNPFNPSTIIKYSVPFYPSPLQGEGPRVRSVTLKVYDLLGREIATLVNEEKSPGNYIVKFNGNNFSSGLYFYTLRAGEFIQTKKMLLIK